MPSWLPDRNRQPSDHAAQRQPRDIRGPRLASALGFRARRTSLQSSKAAGRFGHTMACVRVRPIVGGVRSASRIAFAAPVGGHA
jgi:hypothetical protein